MTDLLRDLKCLAEKKDVPKIEQPKRANKLSREINIIKPNLEAEGVRIHKKFGKEKLWHFEKLEIIDDIETIVDNQSPTRKVVDDSVDNDDENAIFKPEDNIPEFWSS